uniref:Uncharacterized protein n=1 Tax=Pithovirus LCPAC102 TaxID=2506587 RepID=A0A4D5XFF8_9VIRU|nr:MAG: uncharacterized protein LCPAC102_01610 [Pithovirus LCPAC102]
MEHKYPFYIIKLDRAVDEIKKILETEYKEYIDSSNNEIILKPISLVKCIWSFSKKKESNLSLCVFDPIIYDFIKYEYDIERYKISEYSLPKYNETSDLFIKLPDNLSLTYCQDLISSKMKILCDYEIWNKNEYVITYPNKSREFNKHNNKAFIVFDINNNKEDGINKIILTMIFIKGMKWELTELNQQQNILCFWAKKQIRTKKYVVRTNKEKISNYKEHIVTNDTKNNTLNLPVIKLKNTKKYSVENNAWKTPLQSVLSKKNKK